MNAYSSEYYGEGEEKFNGGVERILDHFRKQRAVRLNHYMKKPGKVLDLGCGNGRFLSFMGQLGHKTMVWKWRAVLSKGPKEFLALV